MVDTVDVHACHGKNGAEFFILKVYSETHKAYIPTTIYYEDLPHWQVYNLLTLGYMTEQQQHSEISEYTIELVTWTAALVAAVKLCHSRTTNGTTRWKPDDVTPNDVYEAVMHDGATCCINTEGAFVFDKTTPRRVNIKTVDSAAWRTLVYLTTET